MKILHTLFILISFSLVVQAQNDEPAVSMRDFIRWSRSVQIPGYTFADFDYDGRGLMATFVNATNDTSFALVMDAPSHFSDYRNMLGCTNLKEYTYQGNKSVYFTDGSFSYLYLMLLSGKNVAKIISNKPATAQQLERIAQQSGIADFKARI